MQNVYAMSSLDCESRRHLSELAYGGKEHTHSRNVAKSITSKGSSSGTGFDSSIPSIWISAREGELRTREASARRSSFTLLEDR